MLDHPGKAVILMIDGYDVTQWNDRNKREFALAVEGKKVFQGLTKYIPVLPDSETVGSNELSEGELSWLDNYSSLEKSLSNTLTRLHMFKSRSA